MKVFKLGELFCGPGGLAYGALHAKSSDGQYSIQHAWANDFDADTCETYRKNICPDRPESVYLGDVRDLDIKNLEKIDAFAYGFPCNSFSNVGEHQGLADEKFGQLYWYGIEVLQHFQPEWFIAENVSGIRTAGTSDFKQILDDMRDSGYKLTVHLYKSEEYGIPQTRHRYFIVGIREDLPVTFHVPSPEPYKKIDVSVKTALSNIPPEASNNEIKKLSDRVVGKLRNTLPGQNIWQAMENPNFPEEYKIKKNYRFSQIYRKLDPLKPSYTITANGGGGTWGYHWEGARELTNRERARIQTFPDDYEFVGKYSSVRKQIGMAVPCKLSKIVTEAVLNSFAGIDYPWIEANYQHNNDSQISIEIVDEKINMDDMTPEQRRLNMQHIRSKDTKPEIILRKLLWHKGYRYRKNWNDLPGKPDIVITKYKICIFVDGEYFHGKDWENGKKEKVLEGNNPTYWVPKIERNMQRDKEVEENLKKFGWRVIRFWSRDVLKDPDSCLEIIEKIIKEDN